MQIPSRSTILRADRNAQAALIIVLMWVVLSAGSGFGAMWKNPILTLAFAGMSAIVVFGGGAYVLARTSAIQRLHARGTAVTGRVSEVGGEKASYAVVQYDFEGKSHETRIVSAKRYTIGAAVPLVVDVERPDRATLRLA
jgi:hypothetical protein